MTAIGRPILAEYARAGWALVPIPAGRKGPVTARWNTREMCVSEPEVAEWLDGNVGLAHAYSGTAAVDVDDLARSLTWLSARGIDLQTLLDAPDAVRIESRPGRAKLLYRVEKPLPSYKLGGFELRCAAANGLTVQDVLPPSVHPDTGKPYTWKFNTPEGHWSKLPPLPPQIFNLWSSLIAPTAPKMARATKAGTAAAVGMREILEGLDPDADYDQWIGAGMALHHETEGSQLGLALWNEWSAKGQKYRGLGDLETHWRSFRIDHDNPRTLAGLRTTSPAAPDEFPDMDAAPEAPAAPARSSGAPAGRLPALGPLSDAREQALETLRSVRRSKMGTIEARISNVVAVLGVPEVSGYDLALDEFQDAIMLSPFGGNQWRPLVDADYVQLRVWLETAGNCDPIPHEMMRQAIMLVAERNRMDTGRLWLESLKWDGTPRLETFCADYFGTDATRYERAVGLYMWSALAGRILSPGCQADMVPVLIGRQGCGKSRGVQALVPSPEHYTEIRLDEPDDAIARKTRGVLVGEMAEMRGLRSADVERVKAFVTRTHEKWVPKYREFATNYPRRFLIIGTTNDEEFLPADTEHRRWLPMHTGGVNVAAIARDRDQLWAEAAAYWAVNGIAWEGMDTLAAPARQLAAGSDNWEEPIAAWIFEHKGPVQMHDVMANALGLDLRSTTRAQELRVGRVLRGLGYARTTRREGGKVVRAWDFDPTG